MGQTTWEDMMQSVTEPEMMGRVMSFRMLVSAGLDPLTFAVTGFLIQKFGIHFVFIYGGILVMAIGLFGLSFREVRTKDIA